MLFGRGSSWDMEVLLSNNPRKMLEGVAFHPAEKQTVTSLVLRGSCFIQAEGKELKQNKTVTCLF